MEEDKKENRKQAAASVTDRGAFEVTKHGRRRLRKNRAMMALAWVAITAAIPFTFLAKRIRRKRVDASIKPVKNHVP
ncbi:MAG: hypothetical protein M3O30_06660 [Planctomycetota bacterium]|nr:hypothetical protein [Planctomycetota bacterium]